MDIGLPTYYACDACGKVAQGYTRRVPEGWRRSRWRKGVLEASNATHTDKHYCGEECLAAAKERLNAAKENQ